MKTQIITMVIKYPDEITRPPSLWDWDKLVGPDSDTYTEVISASKPRNLADPDKEDDDVFIPLEEIV